MVKEKRCAFCKKIKVLSDFNKNRSAKDGFANMCKECRKLYRLKNKDYIIQYRNQNKEKHKKQYKEYYQKHTKDVQTRCKKYQQSLAKYNLYAHQLTVAEVVRLSDDGISLEVSCRYCGRYFKPTRRNVHSRIRAINTASGSENFLYCSKHCKEACPVYRQRLYPKGFKLATSREVQPELRQLTLARDNYTCQKCNKPAAVIQLHCHHILPINESPVESADIANCITLCKDCHKEVHKLPNCSYHELRCLS